MKPRVYVTRKVPAEAISMLEAGFEVSSWPYEETPVPHDILVCSARDQHAIFSMLTDLIDQMLLDAAPNLCIVANMAVGFDNIDVDACTRRGVMVTNTPDVSTDSVADLVFGLLIATARRIPEAQRVLLSGGWKSWSPLFMAGRDVHHTTLGILGFGRIGQAVARRAPGFSMRVLYWDKIKRPELEAQIGVEFRELDDLLREADFVTVLLPLNEETYRLIGAREISLMKPTAILINAGRGPVVDNKALYSALVEGRIWAAGLDVYDIEPVNPFDPLVNLPNVVALPHIGSATVPARTAMAVQAASNIVAALSGQIPPNLVNPDVLDVLESKRWPVFTPVLPRAVEGPAQPRTTVHSD